MLLGGVDIWPRRTREEGKRRGSEERGAKGSEGKSGWDVVSGEMTLAQGTTLWPAVKEKMYDGGRVSTTVEFGEPIMGSCALPFSPERGSTWVFRCQRSFSQVSAC